MSGRTNEVEEVTRTVVERGDLAHLALFLWASGASGLLAWSLRELASSNRRFNDFVQEIARLNRHFNDRA
ncbi:hypothetical protein [Breoghania sp.]|uniref:hypothetical protein n=1 Tax=Breoghania sp. TaxID=2065378 RepID=UPI003749FD76